MAAGEKMSKHHHALDRGRPQRVTIATSRAWIGFRLDPYGKCRRNENTPMKFFRYRKPSLKTILGITKAKKQIKKDLGITALLKPFRWWTNKKRKIKRDVGYESDAGRLIRNGLPTPGGCLLVLVFGSALIGMGVAWVVV
jgi:hypothetical protein